MSMPSQRIILGIGLAILLVISAASIGLDLKARSDIASVDQTVAVLKRISDMRSLLRGAESAARGFALTGDEGFDNEYRNLSTTLRAAFDELVAAVEHNEGERRLLEEARANLVRGIDTSGELIRRRAAGDSAGVAALTQSGESRSAMENVGASLQKVVAEERRQLSARTAASKLNGRLLLAIDLVGVVLIVILTIVLSLEFGRSRRELQ